MELTKSAEHSYRRWFTAVEARDVLVLDELLDGGFVYTDLFGTVRDKTGYLRLVEGIPLGMIKMTMKVVQARDLGAYALLHGEYQVEGSLADGTDISSHTRFTALWLVDGTVSRCLTHHATRRAVPG